MATSPDAAPAGEDELSPPDPDVIPGGTPRARPKAPPPQVPRRDESPRPAYDKRASAPLPAPPPVDIPPRPPQDGRQSTAMPLPPVPEILHRTGQDGKTSYLIREKLGSGGFATVYRGEEIPGHQPLAIKCISKTRLTDQKVKEKLLSEVEIHRSLHHPRLVEFRGVFQDDNYVYILLELCPNGTVLDQLRKSSRFSEDQTAKVVREVLEGLIYLHQHRVIHRDLKLQNFLLDANMHLKLADFGLSARLEEDDEKRMTVCGTPGYLTPEVLARQDGQTYSADIWATGVCTFLMLTGAQPFHSKDKRTIYKKIQKCSYSWPPEPAVSPQGHHFVDSALQLNPSDRPTAEALLSHPFILRQTGQVPIPVAPVEPPPLTLPGYAVKIWWDYSHRYGLAYLLHNGVCGACFNDASRILMTPDENLAQYWETPQTPDPEIISMKDLDNSPNRKKLCLIKHFAAELKRRAGDMKLPPLRINLPTDVIAHVKYWANTEDGALFRMANRDIQANFKDHTKLVIESQTKNIFFDTRHGVQQLTMADLSDREKYPEVRRRFAQVKEMAKHLI
jgi:polo-like kinase 1